MSNLGKDNVGAVSDETRMSRWLDEGQRESESHPAEQREQQYRLPLAPAFSNVSPERPGDKFNEWTEPDQHTGLGRVHAQLLEVDSNQGKERAKRGEEEEVEGLRDEQIVVDVGEISVDVLLSSSSEIICNCKR